jgi:hypothetical protein
LVPRAAAAGRKADVVGVDLGLPGVVGVDLGVIERRSSRTTRASRGSSATEAPTTAAAAADGVDGRAPAASMIGAEYSERAGVWAKKRLRGRNTA